MTTTAKPAERVQLHYTVVLTPEEDDKGFFVFVPALTGCFSQGDTVEEALENAREAILLHLEGLQADGEPLPVADVHPLIKSVTVDAPAGSSG
jgi:predicted RNase H-like HicB family nuclease